jgi:hypothetical protein
MLGMFTSWRKRLPDHWPMLQPNSVSIAWNGSLRATKHWRQRFLSYAKQCIVAQIDFCITCCDTGLQRLCPGSLKKTAGYPMFFLETDLNCIWEPLTKPIKNPDRNCCSCEQYKNRVISIPYTVLLYRPGALVLRWTKSSLDISHRRHTNSTYQTWSV